MINFVINYELHCKIIQINPNTKQINPNFYGYVPNLTIICKLNTIMDTIPMTPKERIIALHEYFGLNATTFNESLGFKRGRTESIADGVTQKITNEVASQIVKRYPNVSRRWLLTGNGEMITDSNPEYGPAASNTELVQELRNQIADKNELINQLRQELAQTRESYERLLTDVNQKNSAALENITRTLNSMCRTVQLANQQANDMANGNQYISPGGYGVAERTYKKGIDH